MNLNIILVFLVFVNLSFAADVSITVGTSSPIFTIPDAFLGFNFDWWYNGPAWEGAGFLAVDITNPLLVYLASKLSPAHLRIGGDLQGTIVYQMGGSGNYARCTPGRNCLNVTRWQQLFDFLKTGGISLAFGVDEGGPNWNLTNLENLFSYCVENNYVVYGFEVGNEQNTRWTVAQQVQDAKTIQQLLAKYWPDATTRPKLIAPGCSGSDSYWEQYFAATAGIVEIYTYHAYNGDPNNMMTTGFLDESISSSSAMYTRVHTLSPKAELWMGEGAAAASSGRDHATNAFESGFYYLNVLGTQAQHGHSSSQRQTLVGGWYELINKTTFHPNPDYYSALLWKQLMGTRVLSTTNDLKTNIRVYAHCAKDMTGSVVVLLINLYSTPCTVNFPGLSGLSPRNEYFFSAPNNDYQSYQTQLNGKILSLTVDNKLPPIVPFVVQDDSPVVIPAFNYGFVVFPNANVAACK